MDGHQPAGSTAHGPWTVDTGMRHTGLRVLELEPGGSQSFGTREREAIVVPLAGSCSVRCGAEEFELAGRPGVFEGVSDFAYVPRRSDAVISSEGGGRFAVASGTARRDLPFRRGPAGAVPVETRGTGSCRRQVNNLASADGFTCDRLIVVEVITPDGNWSSYPPHKHDEHTATESELEEVYYFEIGRGGFGQHRLGGSPPGPAGETAEVRTGDVVLVPDGWHGPSAALPGYPMYYLNVMAGPHDERAWRITDDPAHAWVRDTWGAAPATSSAEGDQGPSGTPAGERDQGPSAAPSKGGAA